MTSIVDTPEFRSQLSFKEYYKYLSDMKAWCEAFHVSMRTIRVESGGLFEYACETQSEFDKFSAWNTGYLMALGFNKDCVRE